MIDNWRGLYRKGWNGNLVPEAFSHPAKVSFGLAEKIYQHMAEEGWIDPGAVVVDPFGGIAGCAFHAMRHGCNWIGCELEEKFVTLGNQNIALWNNRYSVMPGWGSARLVQGDSRRLLEVIAEAGAVVSSPPYAESEGHPSIGSINNDDWGKDGRDIAARRGLSAEYGATPGQLGAMPARGFEASVSSPPWLATEGGAKPINGDDALMARHAAGNMNVGFGQTEGQLTNADDFWTSARLIIDQVYAALEPGGHAVWIVKAFVKNKQRVDFPGQWRQMCEAAGFTTLHEHRAWLVEDRGTQIDLEGNHHSKKVERKSFFRRLAENKGSPRIDWETVYCMVKEA